MKSYIENENPNHNKLCRSLAQNYLKQSTHKTTKYQKTLHKILTDEQLNKLNINHHETVKLTVEKINFFSNIFDDMF